jgi:hypothetical protein
VTLAPPPPPHAARSRSRSRRKPPAPPQPSADPPSSSAPLIAETPTIDVAPPPTAPAPSAADAAVQAEIDRATSAASGGADELAGDLAGVLTPEAAGMLLDAAFGVVSVATRSPEIWQATSDEIRPLEKPLAHQLARLPFVQTVGVDNTELGILIIGLLVMVTTRLNEYAQKRQLEISRPAARGSAAAPPAPAAARVPADPESRAAELLSPTR